MKSSRRFMLLLAVATLCSTSRLLEAAAVEGRFTLPHEVHWGTATLPAGDYTFTLDRATLDGRILLRRGTEGVALIMAQGIESASPAGSSSMLIVANEVRSLRLAPVGLTYIYQIHPERRQTFARNSSVRGVTVSVAMK